MRDIIEQIRQSRPSPDVLTPLDTDGLQRHARRRDAVSRAAGAMAVVMLVAGGVAVADAVSPTSGGINIVDPGGAPYSDSGDAATDTDWASLDVDSAADRLIELSHGQQAPQLPPPAGHIFKAHDIYVSHERGQDGSWVVSESVLEADAQARGTRTSGTAAIPGLDDDAGRAEIVEMTQQHRPALTESVQIGPDQQDGISWKEENDARRQLAAVREQLDSDGTMDPAMAAGLSAEPEARIELLELIKAHSDIVTYRGLIPDLVERETVAFSLPLSSGLGGGTATLLFSPEDATSHGWEYHNNHNSLRMETLIAVEVTEVAP